MKSAGPVTRRDVLTAGVAAGATAFGLGSFFRNTSGALDQCAPMSLKDIIANPELKPLAMELIPARITDELEKHQQAILEDARNPNVVRFDIPRTKQFVQEITWKLLEGSGLLVPDLTPIILVNDSSWGMPSANMRAGVLSVEPEGVGVMRSNDMVAALIAHELTHHIRGHSAVILMLLEQYPRTATSNIFESSKLSEKEVSYRKGQEIEADVLSLLLLENAGYDPYASLDCLRSVHREINEDTRYTPMDRRIDPIHGSFEERSERLQYVLKRWRLEKRSQSTTGFPLVYRELADRCRPGEHQSKARDLYRHYNQRLP